MRDPKILSEVKSSLALLAEIYPGKAIEVRIPPYAAVQCGDGPKHTRGTPPNVIEMDAQTWLQLVAGQRTWSDAYSEGLISASGVRADLSHLLPLAGKP
ncbi:Bacterial SCP orthologue [Candidatus Nanopelagicaceae bacterium]